MAQYIYMVVTNDIYEFPVAMAGSVQELARMIGVRPNTISSAMSHAKSRGQRCKYVKVELDEEEDNVNYKIGQILISNKETIVEKALSCEKVVVPKGNKIIIGADKFAHHIKNGMIQPLQKGTEVKGYDAEGLAEYLYLKLRSHFLIDEMLEDYDLTSEEFKSEIEYYLDDIGF